MFRLPTLSLLAALCLPTALCMPAAALAQPAATLHLLTSFVPGASGDAMARALSDKMRASLGDTVVVEPKAGAGGRIAMEQLKTSKPDGRTVLLKIGRAHV